MLSLFLLLGLSAAGGEAGDTHELRPGSPIELAANAASDLPSLEIRWLDLADSRCPVGVNCIVAGQAQLRLEVRLAGQDPEERVLVLAAGRRLGPHDQVATVGPYRLELLAVHPYPQAEKRAADKDLYAVLSVTESEDDTSESDAE